MAVNSKQKGNRVEREACELLRSLGFQAERTQQYCGRSTDSADIRHDIPGVRLEVKGGYDGDDVGGSTPSRWLSKLKAECVPGERAVVLWKRSRRPWLAIVELGGMVALTADVALALSPAGFEKE